MVDWKKLATLLVVQTIVPGERCRGRDCSTEDLSPGQWILSVKSLTELKVQRPGSWRWLTLPPKSRQMESEGNFGVEGPLSERLRGLDCLSTSAAFLISCMDQKSGTVPMAYLNTLLL